MKPPYLITSKVLNLVSKISEILGRYDAIAISAPEPQLRKQNRIKTIQGTLSIEGNTLTIDQVTAIVDNRKVIGPAQDILEVKNAICLYEQIEKFSILSIKDFCKAHKILMNQLHSDAGKFRTKNVGILKGSQVSHVAPKHTMVSELMNNLFQYIKQNKTDHILILSSVFHYEMEFIHPFEDGNGRMGRFWQSAMLNVYNQLFKYIPVESIIKENQQEYYKVLGDCDKSGESTLFIEFMLEIILNGLTDFYENLIIEPVSFDSRINKAKEVFAEKKFSRKDYLNLFKNISTATASRDLKQAFEKGIIKKLGEKNQAVYCFFSRI